MSIDFAQTIVDFFGYTDWRVVEIRSGGGLCVRKTKEIWIDFEHIHSVPWIIHEIAHIERQGHDSHWADWYTLLLDKYYSVAKGNW